MTKDMKRRNFLKAGAVALPAAVLAAPAIAQGKIQWKLPSSFPAKAPGVGTNSANFAKRVEEMSGGRLSFKIYSAGELVPAFGVEDAVQQGVAEIGHSAAYFAAGKNSALHFFSNIPFGMTATEHYSWLKYGGGQELWDEISAERNLKPFYVGNSGAQSAGWFKKPIESVADLSGLNMRIAGLGGEVIRKLGVNAVLLPPPEIFAAFQSGAIDAAEWVGPMLDQAFGLNKVAEYCYLPAFHEPSAAIELVVNKDAYDALPDDLKAIITYAAEAASADNDAEFDYFNSISFAKLKEDGVKFAAFPDDVIAALRKATDEVLQEQATANPQFARVMESYNATLERSRAYGSAMKAPSMTMRDI